VIAFANSEHYGAGGVHPAIGGQHRFGLRGPGIVRTTADRRLSSQDTPWRFLSITAWPRHHHVTGPVRVSEPGFLGPSQARPSLNQQGMLGSRLLRLISLERDALQRSFSEVALACFGVRSFFRRATDIAARSKLQQPHGTRPLCRGSRLHQTGPRRTSIPPTLKSRLRMYSIQGRCALRAVRSMVFPDGRALRHDEALLVVSLPRFWRPTSPENGAGLCRAPSLGSPLRIAAEAGSACHSETLRHAERAWLPHRPRWQPLMGVVVSPGERQGGPG